MACTEYLEGGVAYEWGAWLEKGAWPESEGAGLESGGARSE